jgi:hypothetical protein
VAVLPYVRRIRARGRVVEGSPWHSALSSVRKYNGREEAHMRMTDLLQAVGAKLREAEDRVDVAECIRVAGVAADALRAYIEKCEAVQAERTAPRGGA